MLFNTNYKPVRPPDYQSKFKIPYQKQTDFYNVEVYNDGLYLLEKELENIELTDEKLHVVTEDKKLSEVLPTVARKVETEALKARDIELQSAIDGIKQDISNIKQDIGGYAKRLETANNGIEARL